ncbi:cupin domain-containing protein [Paracoccus sp. MBLB3053]|uniref:Cupin domain-containing protein n=1 Tax=Paracoccus aurantius TaxID=3073814 RepID=A0ABU2I060_9RHOB|nr:cupin domain-containing protein [Paracoccus sp. MBLB3053]MDS9469924.1 cupin domain-containing protein [Paracoccus sp. MBLB3053]
MTATDPDQFGIPETEDDRSLGLAVRAARKKSGRSLKQVADSAGISVGLLSQIERGISSPSVRVLRAVCVALDIPVLSLFDSGDQRSEREAQIIVRAGRRRSVDFGDRGFMKSFLNAHENGALQVMELVLQEGGGSGEDSYQHEGEECGLVVSGQIELAVDGDVFRLGPGDSFHFQSELPHRFRNLHAGETRVIWVTTPPVW